MKNNYRKALQRAQKGTTIKPPKAQIQTADEAIIPSSNRTVVPQQRERTWLGSQATKIGNWFRPDHRDLDTDYTLIDPNSRENIKTYQFNPDWGDTQQTIPINENQYYPGAAAFGSGGINPALKNGGDIGKENYMSALKTFKKGGSK